MRQVTSYTQLFVNALVNAYIKCDCCNPVTFRELNRGGSGTRLSLTRSNQRGENRSPLCLINNGAISASERALFCTRATAAGLTSSVKRRTHPIHEFRVDFAQVGELDFVVAHPARSLFGEAVIGR